MPDTLISHINSYLVSSSLHAELLNELSNYDAVQDVFVPAGRTAHIGMKAPAPHPNVRVTYEKCFNTADKVLWPNKIRKIRNAYSRHSENSLPKLVHAHSLMVNGLVALLNFRKRNIPYIVSVRYTDVHVFMKKSAIFRKLGFAILERAQQILFLSPAYLNYHMPSLFTEAQCNIIRKKSHVIPNGIHLFWLENKNAQAGQKPVQDTRKVLFAGTLTKRKNPIAVLNACDLLNNRGIATELHLVGEGPLRSTLEKQAGPTPVKLHGFISDKEEIKQLYRQSDVLVVPSFRETFGLVYAEALSQGLPVIYSRNEGFDGFFPDGHVGYSVDPGNIEDIADRIHDCLIEHTDIAVRAVQESARFSWEQIGSQIAGCYGIQRHHHETIR